MRASRFDIAISGAGPVGTALALALQGSGKSVALLGPRRAAAAPAAARPIALSYASRLILERLRAWEGLAASPIEEIHVSQAGAFGRTVIRSSDLGLPALGYVTTQADIESALASGIDPRETCLVESDAPGEVAVPARLKVQAQGTPAGGADKDYGHTAIVTTVASDRPAHATAFERFTGQGPLALLPLGTRYGVVWSRSAATAAALMQCEDAAFIEALQAAFGTRAGRFVSIGPREAAPLVLRRREPRAIAGEIYIGNAAQTLHPVAGQGLNLGLRDAWELACLLRQADGEAPACMQFAERFARARRLDACGAIRGTDLLATLYTRGDPLSRMLRGAALTGLDLLPAARRMLAKRMIYGASAW